MIKKIILLLTVLLISHANLQASTDDSWVSKLNDAIDLSKTTGRELHLVLGSLPIEPHIQDLLREEDPETAPIRVYFASGYKDTSPPDDVEWPPTSAPTILDNFNSDDIWLKIQTTMKSKDYGFDKIYFDWSTVKFVEWPFMPTANYVLSSLKLGGSLYVPSVYLWSKLDEDKKSKLSWHREKYNKTDLFLEGKKCYQFLPIWEHSENGTAAIMKGERAFEDPEYQYQKVFVPKCLPVLMDVFGFKTTGVENLNVEQVDNTSLRLYPLSNPQWSSNGGQPGSFAKITRR